MYHFEAWLENVPKKLLCNQCRELTTTGSNAPKSRDIRNHRQIAREYKPPKTYRMVPIKIRAGCLHSKPPRPPLARNGAPCRVSRFPQSGIKSASSMVLFSESPSIRSSSDVHCQSGFIGMLEKHYLKKELRWYPHQQERIRSSVMCIGFNMF